jgi:hypothetical protein
MTRLIDNQRTQIGTLMSLGYSNRKIRLHYLSYGLWMGLIGGLLGIVIGYRVIPEVLIQSIRHLAIVPYFDAPLTIGSFVSVVIMVVDGAGILDIYTEKGTRRFINDVVLESEFFKTKLVGFENHSGRTFINNYQPLGKIMYGNGNNGEDGNEGLIYKSTVCTYLHGCCLSKNPEISKFMIEKAISRRYGETVEISIDTKLSNAAKKDIINRYSK